MTKLLGAVLVLCGGVWGRWVQLNARRHRRQTLAGTVSALHQMAEEIRMARTPLPVLLELLGRSCNGREGLFFKAVQEGIHSGEMAAQAWQNALSVLELPQRQVDTLAELGDGLHGDEEKICKAILLAARRLERDLEAWDRAGTEVERRDTGLWLSATALTVILLV